MLAPDLPLFAVADGMGGHKAGRYASNYAVEAVHEYVRQEWMAGIPLDETVLRCAVDTANHLVFADAEQDRAKRGMGTTLTALMLVEDEFLICHVGDSKALRCRNGQCEQLTEDHSIIAERLRQGILSPEQAASHPQRSVLSRSLGTRRELEVDILRVPVVPGDVFVLASDGLFSGVDGETIAAVITEAISAQDACDELVTRACKADDSDNVTVLIVACRTITPADRKATNICQEDA